MEGSLAGTRAIALVVAAALTANARAAPPPGQSPVETAQRPNDVASVERVGLKTPDGLFLRADESGVLRADVPLPTRRARFEILHNDGQSLLVGDCDGKRQLVETPVQICRVRPIPGSIRVALALAIKALVIEEIGKKEYDKVESKLKKEYLELPAPTLRDLKRKKRHRVLVYREETHLRARLTGLPEIEVVAMAYVVPSQEAVAQTTTADPPQTDGTEATDTNDDAENGVDGRLMFSIRARLPLEGHATYRIPKRLSASTGFRAVAHLDLAGELAAGQADDRLSLGSPELLDVRARLERLDLSNDLLNLGRTQIERLINHELHRNRHRIREQGNKTLRKAMKSQEVQHPLLRWFGEP